MKILVTGLCTLHWGRLQYGNIGNYYIIEPLFRELHRVFPASDIVTTFQMTNDFILEEKITVVPMEWYYAWKDDDVAQVEQEYEFILNQKEENWTDYMNLLNECDLLINVSGDMWGDNAEHVGKSRFYVDLLKMRIAQLMKVKTVLFAGTPGPFSDKKTQVLAKEVYKNFDLVINREPTSTQNMRKWGFESKNVKDFACPAFLYEPELTEIENNIVNSLIKKDKRINAGFTIGGFNMPVAPYDMWPRSDEQYVVFAEIIEHMVNNLDMNVYLISHTNGFELPPNFKLINGRDYPILKQLREVVIKRRIIKNENQLILLKEPCLPRMTKKIIGQFEMMVTGRVHASVAAISQYVPTVFLTYDQRWISSTKMYGFSSLVGVGDLVCEPENKQEILEKVDYCYRNLEKIKKVLLENIPIVKDKARKAFDEMKILIED